MTKNREPVVDYFAFFLLVFVTLFLFESFSFDVVAILWGFRSMYFSIKYLLTKLAMMCSYTAMLFACISFDQYFQSAFIDSHITHMHHISDICFLRLFRKVWNLKSFLHVLVLFVCFYLLLLYRPMSRVVFICTCRFSNCFVRAYHIRSQLNWFCFVCCQIIPNRWE